MTMDWMVYTYDDGRFLFHTPVIVAMNANKRDAACILHHAILLQVGSMWIVDVWNIEPTFSPPLSIPWSCDPCMKRALVSGISSEIFDLCNNQRHRVLPFPFSFHTQ